MLLNHTYELIRFENINHSKDADFFAKVRNESSFYLDNSSNFNPDEVKIFLEKEYSNYRIVNLDNVKIGYIRLRETVIDTQKVNLVGLDLATAFRGQGLAQQIYRKLIKFLEQKNLPIMLYVLDFNLRARRVYDKVGFLEINRDPFVQSGSNRNCTRILMEYQSNHE